MSIVASVIAEDAAQVDGRRHIAERHTDHLGVFHFVRYMASPEFDAAAALAARVAQVEASLASAEMAVNLTKIDAGDHSVTAQHNTVDTVRAALRAAYQVATGEQVGRLAAFLLTLTDAQLRTLFNMTQAQVNQLKTRLQARADALTTVLTATGE